MEGLNLYIITTKRNKATILSFINNVKKNKLLKLLNDELMVVPLDFIGDLEQIDDYDWISINNINDVIEFGSLHPPRAFSCYLSINDDKINGIILGFTVDNYLILGLSLQDSDQNYEYAKELLKELLINYGATSGGVFVEQIPALSKDLFEKYLNKNSLFRL